GFHLGARVEEPHGRLLALHLPGRGRGRHCRPGGGGAEEFALAARRHAEAATGSAARRQVSGSTVPTSATAAPCSGAAGQRGHGKVVGPKITVQMKKRWWRISMHLTSVMIRSIRLWSSSAPRTIGPCW
ncbi:unnamed protein product, partial [Durusdinium trenchii]